MLSKLVDLNSIIPKINSQHFAVTNPYFVEKLQKFRGFNVCSSLYSSVGIRTQNQPKGLFFSLFVFHSSFNHSMYEQRTSVANTKCEHEVQLELELECLLSNI